METPRKRFYHWRNWRTIETIMSTLLSCTSLIVYDFETTGFDPQNDRPIELAAIRFALKNGHLLEKERLHLYFRVPDDIELPQEVSELTGLTRKQLEMEPMEEEEFGHIATFFSTTPVVGYNSNHFDNAFMRQLYERNSAEFFPQYEFDVLHMARDFTPQSLENFKLQTVTNHWGIKAERYHSAYCDTEVTAELLKQFIESYQSGRRGSPTGTRQPEIRNITCEGRVLDGQRQEPQRIYVNTGEGTIYYDILQHIWYSESNILDMDWVEQQAWLITGVNNEVDFGQFRGRAKL